MTRYIKYPTSIGVKDLCCTGINPLRCVVCQVNRKLDGMMTCKDQSCIVSYKSQNNLAEATC